MNTALLIATRRKELGLTLEDIAQYVGVSKSTVKKWESGYIKNMKRDKMALLAGILKISPMALLDDGEHSSQNIYTPEEVSHIKKYRALDEDGRELVDRLLDTLHTQKTDKLEDSSDEITAS